MPKTKTADKPDDQPKADAKTESAPARHEVAQEPSLSGVGPDDPTYQKPAIAPADSRPDTPEERRDAVNADIEAMHKGQ